MANESLGNAKKAKNDEFYTQYEDIQREMNAYLEYDPDVFNVSPRRPPRGRGKGKVESGE